MAQCEVERLTAQVQQQQACAERDAVLSSARLSASQARVEELESDAERLAAEANACAADLEGQLSQALAKAYGLEREVAEHVARQAQDEEAAMLLVCDQVAELTELVDRLEAEQARQLGEVQQCVQEAQCEVERLTKEVQLLSECTERDAVLKSELLSQLGASETKVQELECEMARLTAEAEERVNEHKAKHMEIVAAQQEQTELAGKLCALEGQAASLAADKATLQGELDTAAAEATALQTKHSAEVNGLTQELGDERSQHDVHLKAIAALESELTAHAEQLATLKYELDAATSDREAAKADLVALTKQVTEFQALIERLEGQLVSVCDEAGLAAGREEAALKRVGQLEAELEAQRTGLEEEVAAIKTANAVSQQEKEAAQKQQEEALEAAVAELAGLQDDMAKSAYQLGQAITGLESKGCELEASKQALLEANRHREETDKALSETRSHHEVAKQALSDKECELASVREEAASHEEASLELVLELETSVRGSKEELGAHKATLAEQARANAALQQEIEAARKQADSMEALLSGEKTAAATLQTELAGHAERLCDLQARVAGMTSEKAALVDELDAAMGDRNAAEEDLAALQLLHAACEDPAVHLAKLQAVEECMAGEKAALQENLISAAAEVATLHAELDALRGKHSDLLEEMREERDKHSSQAKEAQAMLELLAEEECAREELQLSKHKLQLELASLTDEFERLARVLEAQQCKHASEEHRGTQHKPPEGEEEGGVQQRQRAVGVPGGAGWGAQLFSTYATEGITKPRTGVKSKSPLFSTIERGSREMDLSELSHLAKEMELLPRLTTNTLKLIYNRATQLHSLSAGEQYWCRTLSYQHFEACLLCCVLVLEQKPQAGLSPKLRELIQWAHTVRRTMPIGLLDEVKAIARDASHPVSGPNVVVNASEPGGKELWKPTKDVRAKVKQRLRDTP
eukprot:TRINITY_DN7152_c0_g1_i5.p1 TRINITY_DN7152_c0_g1~~TRINITY_DN7152_c0_g1_i5.p1  ORF type:complete len:935 (+),score=349.33 TRINITY_DN7152_c0_g1_i5:562-3366(+)